MNINNFQKYINKTILRRCYEYYMGVHVDELVAELASAYRRKVAFLDELRKL